MAMDRRSFCRVAGLGAAAAATTGLRGWALGARTAGATAASAGTAHVSAAGAAAQARAAVRARIEAGRGAQEIAGFGASGAFHMADLLDHFPADERGRVLDALFATTGTGAGLSMVRNIIPAGDRRAPGIEPASGQWNWEGDAGQIGLMREAAQRGCTRFVSTAWTPPAWMKTNNNIVGGRLRRDRYDDYADYLAEYAAQYRSRHGLDIHAISPQNEPDVTVKYASCYWSGEEYREFVKSALGPTWRRRKPAARIMLGEPSTWTEAPVVPALEDAEAREAIDIVAAHAYFGDNAAPEIRLTDRIGDFPVARGLGKPIWQTEVSAFNGNDAGIADALYWAKLLHFHLSEDNVSGWFYWWLVSPRNDREALVQLDPASGGGAASAPDAAPGGRGCGAASAVGSANCTGPRRVPSERWLANKRLFALGQYSRFARPGARRVAADANPAPGVYVSAYRQGEGLAIVAINDNKEAVAAEFAVAGLAPKTVEGYRTSAFEELRPLKAGGAGPFGAGGPFGGGAPTLKAGTEGAEAVVAATLAGESVTTYVAG